MKFNYKQLQIFMKTLSTFLKSIGYINKTIQLIDVGARWGTNPPWDKMDASVVKYLGFEPDPKEYAKLKLRNNENIEYLPLGLADKVSDYTLNITHAAGCSSIYEPNNEFMSRFYLAKLWDVEKKVDIKTVPLSQVLDEKKLVTDVL
jgi:FkbM family methyltransferase